MPTVTVTTSPYVLAAGGSLSVTDSDALLLQSTDLHPPDITINGRVTVSSAAVTGLGARLSGLRIGDGGFYVSNATVGATGSIHVDTTAGFATAYGFEGGSWSPELLNQGLIDVLSKRDAFGVYTFGTDLQNDTAVNNTGTIHVVAQTGAATGVYMGAGDGFANAGVIDVTGSQLAEGVHFFQWAATFQNTGTIRAISTTPGVDSVAVYFNSTVQNGFVNAGVLQGDYALKVIDYYGAPIPNGPLWPIDTFENQGQMIGKVDLGFDRQVLLNSGSIVGDVNLGSGDDVYNGRAGSVVGLVSAGDGNDSLQGGAKFDYLQGNAGNDTVAGAGGDDWLLGGKDDDNLDGGDGADLLYGNLGDDWLDGESGADTIRGGQGNDVIFGHDGADWLSGDRGNDTISGGAGADIFHGSQDAGIDRVTDFNVAEGDKVVLDPGTTFSIGQVGGDTVIDMGGGNQMILVGVQMSTLPPGTIVLG